MTAEAVLRWACTVLAVAALVVLALQLGATTSPAVAAGVVLAVALALSVVLWRRHLERVQTDRDVARARERGAAPVDNGRY